MPPKKRTRRDIQASRTVNEGDQDMVGSTHDGANTGNSATNWDFNNPMNWTLAMLVDRLREDKGIKAPRGAGKKFLTQLYLDNEDRDENYFSHQQRTNTQGTEAEGSSQPQQTQHSTQHVIAAEHRHKASLSSIYPQYTIKANNSDFTVNLGNFLET